MPDASLKTSESQFSNISASKPIVVCIATHSSRLQPFSETLSRTLLQVIKVGTSSLIRPQQNSLNLTSLAGIVEGIRELKDSGYNVVLVSSGAVGVGCQRLGLENRPCEVAKKQALAAVGQVHLMRYYDDLFSALGMKCAQVLLTLDNLSNRSSYINARNTFQELLAYGAVPIVNENDTVAIEQLRIGDNDTLSAQVATLVGAGWLFLLTDVNALYTSNPNIDPDARAIHSVPSIAKLTVDTSTKGTLWGTGGMATKLTAARMATAAGCRMVICHYSEPKNVMKILNGEQIGTIFHPLEQPLKGRKRWILAVPVKGKVYLDAGALIAIRDRHKSLFPAGIIKTDGDFGPQDGVTLCDANGMEFARGLVNYSKEEIDDGRGMNSKAFMEMLGYAGQEEVISRANICLMLANDSGDDEKDAQPLSKDDSRSMTPAPPHEDEFRLSLVKKTLCEVQQAEICVDDVQGVRWADEMGEAVRAELKEALEIATAGATPTIAEDISDLGWLPK